MPTEPKVSLGNLTYYWIWVVRLTKDIPAQGPVHNVEQMFEGSPLFGFRVRAKRSESAWSMGGLMGHRWIGPESPSGDSGFVCGAFGYQGSGQSKRLPVDSVESSGGMATVFAGDLGRQTYPHRRRRVGSAGRPRKSWRLRVARVRPDHVGRPPSLAS